MDVNRRSTLRLLMCQTDIPWQDPEAAFEKLNHWLLFAKSTADIIILPEMFTTGFTMTPALVPHELLLKGLEWMKQASRETGAAVCGSLAWPENGKYYNRFYWTEPSGKTLYYDKKHLFSLSKEPEVYTSGNESLLIDFRGWKIKPMVCFDLRFPVWCRNNSGTPFDLMIFVANWPAVRSEAWKLLLRARAAENQVYVAGVNRFGTDGNGMYHHGDSLLADPYGTVLDSIAGAEGMLWLEPDLKVISDCRNKLPFLASADRFGFL